MLIVLQVLGLSHQTRLPSQLDDPSFPSNSFLEIVILISTSIARLTSLWKVNYV